MINFQHLKMNQPTQVKKSYPFNNPDETLRKKNGVVLLAIEFLANLILIKHEEKVEAIRQERIDMKEKRRKKHIKRLKRYKAIK